jgi:hypothetical protein
MCINFRSAKFANQNTEKSSIELKYYSISRKI